VGAITKVANLICHPPVKTPTRQNTASFAAMSYSDAMDDLVPTFYIGQHETSRSLNVSSELVQHAQDLGVCSITPPYRELIHYQELIRYLFTVPS
jgi:hypothetical protein